jgi:hypothetical protein
MKKQLTECGCNGNQDYSNTSNYMFFENLKTIKKSVDAMLQMDPKQVDRMLSSGHGWAVDHIATSKDDVEEVGAFIMNAMQTRGMKISGVGMMGDYDNDTAYNSQQPQFVPVTLNNHAEMKNFIREIIRKVKDGYRLYSHKGKNLGTFDTKSGAEKHEREVNYFKHSGK